MKNITKSKKGFSLLEIVLYIGLASIMIFVISLMLVNILESRFKNEGIAEVESQGTAVLNRISQTIYNADGINSPVKGNSANSLSIDVVSPSADPTIFDISNGILRIKEGAASAVNLTNSRVTASGLTFTNVSKNSRQNIIRIQFTITYLNNSSRLQYDYSKTFYLTVQVGKKQ